MSLQKRKKKKNMATEYKHLTNSLQGCKFGFAIFVYRGKQ
jgi:hypothetical protein